MVRIVTALRPRRKHAKKQGPTAFLTALSVRVLEGGGSHEEISYRLGRLGCGGISAERDVMGCPGKGVTIEQQTPELWPIWQFGDQQGIADA